MKKLKILFNTSPGAFRNVGGGEIQLLETKKELEKKGHTVKILEKEKYKVDFADFDIFHNFNIHRDNLQFVLKAKQAGLPVAVSTIYWPSLKYSLLQGSGISKKAKSVAAELMKHIDMGGYGAARKILHSADALLPNSNAEAQMLKHRFGADHRKTHVVPNGVDERFKSGKPRLFRKESGLKDFVLYVGRIEERKNLLPLVKAMNSIGENLAVVGDAKTGSEKYLQKCREAASGNIVFMRAIPHESELLESAYAACKVFALPSWYETPGLAALEAGLAGANLVVTKEGCTREYFGDMALYADPASSSDIKNKVFAALQRPKEKALRRHIEGNFLWKNAAEETEKAYQKILG